MAHSRPISYEQSSGRLRALYDDICELRGLETPPNWAIYMGHAPNVLESMWQMVQITEHNSLSPLLTQLLLFAVSVENSSTYCMEYHGSMILKLDNNLEHADLLQLVSDDSRGVIPDHYRVAIQVATAQVARRCHLPRDEADRLKQAGFSESECLEIIGVISLATMLNSFTMAADVPIDAEYRIPGFRI